MVRQDQIHQIIMLTNLTEGKKVILFIDFLMSKKKSVNYIVGMLSIVLLSFYRWKRNII